MSCKGLVRLGLKTYQLYFPCPHIQLSFSSEITWSITIYTPRPRFQGSNSMHVFKAGAYAIGLNPWPHHLQTFVDKFTHETSLFEPL